MTGSDAFESYEDAVQRARRSWQYGMWTGAVLMTGPIVGLLVYVSTVLWRFSAIESEKAPTPKMLAAGIRGGMTATVLGALVGAFGFALFFVCLLRLRRMDREHRVQVQDWSS